jgi:uncharacterized membrane protein
MKWLVLVHVLSAIIGIGPTYAFLVVLRKNQSVQELRFSLKMGKILELFPKILGSLAVVTGLVLFFVGDYGQFTQLWLIGSLILYVIIQVIVIVFVPRSVNSLTKWVADPANNTFQALPSEETKLLGKALNFTYLACFLGIVLFAFMIMKPA